MIYFCFNLPEEKEDSKKIKYQVVRVGIKSQEVSKSLINLLIRSDKSPIFLFDDQLTYIDNYGSLNILKNKKLETLENPDFWPGDIQGASIVKINNKYF